MPINHRCNLTKIVLLVVDICGSVKSCWRNQQDERHSIPANQYDLLLVHCLITYSSNLELLENMVRF